VLAPARFDALAAGALAATLLRDPALATVAARWCAKLVLAAAAVLAVVAIAGRGLHPSRPATLIAGLSAFAALYAAWLVRIATSQRPSRWLESAPLRFLGRHSYAIYLCHQVYVRALDELGYDRAFLSARLGSPHAGALVFLAAITAASVISALLAWQLLEKPALALKRRFPRPL
jgi:peptidoglycan/LPS O-acetylase OafA/YrhL